MARVEGNNGQIDFAGGFVRITRDGFAGGASHLEPISIPIAAITDVVIHPPNAVIPGFIHFQSIGHVVPGGYVSAAKDQRSVVFKKKKAAEFEELAAAVRGAVGRH